jgi:hypothetical protein
MEPKITQEIVDDEVIYMMTNGRAICELSVFGMKKNKEFLSGFDIECPYPLFFFHRIRSVEESMGHGTVLMKRLIEICDEKGIAILNSINPYGRMNLEELKEWFGKYGFFEVSEHVIVRFPEEKSENQS